MNINTDHPCDPRNYRKGRRDTIKYIVIHYVGATGSALDNVKYYGSSDVGASAHFYVGHASENGAVYQSVDPKDCAWHCGHDRAESIIIRSAATIMQSGSRCVRIKMRTAFGILTR